MTTIEWTRNDDGTPGKTWNPLRGCSRVSPGCGDDTGGGCYAMRTAHRFDGPGLPYEGLTTLRRGKVDWSGRVRFVPDKLSEPLRWRKPQRVFVNSMSDLFHESVANETIAAVFGVMAATPQHEYIVLTKRAKRMRQWFEWVSNSDATGIRERGYEWTDCHAQALARDVDGLIHKRSAEAPGRPWPLPNLILCVSAENQPTADERVPHLLATPAVVRGVSCEPLLGPIDLTAFLPHNPPYETDRNGRDSIRGRALGLDRGEAGRVGLARGAPPPESVEFSNDNNGDGAASDRRFGGSRVPHSQDHGRRQTDDHPGAPSRVAGPQRADTAGTDDQPQERREARQQTREPGTGDLLRADDARLPLWPGRRARGEEPRGEAHGFASGRDSASVRHERGDAGGTGSDVQRDVSDDFPNRAGRISSTAARADSGLREPTQPSDPRAWSQREIHLDLVIVGSESGHGARHMRIEWAESLRDQCRASGVAFFTKQIASAADKKGGSPEHWPPGEWPREWPEVRR